MRRSATLLLNACCVVGQHDWKDTISGVHISPGSPTAETLVRRGGTAHNRKLIACSVSNISAKNYQNRLLLCVDVSVCNISVGFWDTVWFKLPSLTAGWVARLPVEKTHTAASCIAGWDSSNWHCHSISEEHEYWSGSVLMGAAPFHRSFAGWQCEHYRWQYWACIFDRGLHGNWRDILFFFTDSGNMEKITNNNRQIQK